jgi:hypothetical protein
MNLSKNVKLTKVKDASSAGQTAVNSDSVDMANWDGVIFFTNAGAITSTGVQSINLAQSSDDSSFSDLAGTKVDIADDDDNQVFFLDVFRPVDRYVRLEIARATADSAFGPIYAIRYGPRVLPVNNNVTDVSTGETHISPAEGTA